MKLGKGRRRVYKMAVKNEEVFANLTVVKRDGKKMEFKPKKIAIAIKKGFDNLKTAQYAHLSLGVEYTEKDSQKVI